MTFLNGRPWPDDFAFRYEYHAGSQPPDYYEYVIEVSPDGSGEVHFWPDHPANDPDEEVKLFTPDEQALVRVYHLLQSAGLCHEAMEPLGYGDFLGGAYVRLEVNCGGRSAVVKGPLSRNDAENLIGIFEEIKALVPEEFWNRVGQGK